MHKTEKILQFLQVCVQKANFCAAADFFAHEQGCIIVTFRNSDFEMRAMKQETLSVHYILDNVFIQHKYS